MEIEQSKQTQVNAIDAQYNASPQIKKVSPEHLLFKQIICIIPIAFAIFIMVMSAILVHKTIYVDQELGPAKEVLNFVQDNLIKPPITSLKSYHLSEDCTVKGYDGIPLGMFSEVHNGCICSDGSYYRSAYCYAVPRFGKTCSPVSFSDEVPIYYWPSDYSKDQRICVKRIKKFKFAEAGVCPQGFPKLCVKDRICLPEEDNCPLTTMEITDKHDPALILEEGIMQFGSATKPNHVKLDNKIQTKGQPFVGFEISPGIPCWEENREVKFADPDNFYPFSDVKQLGCGEEYQQATKYFELVTRGNPVGERNLYDFNNNVKAIVDSLPFANQYFVNKHELSLYLERRIELAYEKKQCHNIEAEDASTINNTSRSLRAWLKGFSITNLVLSSISILLAIIFFPARNKRINTKNPVKAMYICFACISLIVIAGGIIFLILQAGEKGLKSIKLEFEGYQTNRCFVDEKINQAINIVIDFANETLYGFGINWMVCFWVTIGVVILAAIVIFLKYRKFITYPILENPWEVPAVVEVKEVVTK